MIIRGRGAYVDPKDKRLHGLTQGEYDLLKIMMKTYTVGLPANVWATRLGLPEHRVSGFLSYLKGMDLIKASSDESMQTDEEKSIMGNVKGSAVFWIGEQGTPIFKRAAYALENKKMTDILDERMQFDLPLWPRRPEDIVTFKAIVVQLDAHRLCLEFSTTTEKMEKLAQFTDTREVMINIESM